MRGTIAVAVAALVLTSSSVEAAPPAAPPVRIEHKVEFSLAVTTYLAGSQTAKIDVPVIANAQNVPIKSALWSCAQRAIRQDTADGGSFHVLNMSVACSDGRSTVKSAIACVQEIPGAQDSSLMSVEVGEVTYSFFFKCKTTDTPVVAAMGLN